MRIFLFVLLLTTATWAEPPEATVEKLYTWLRKADARIQQRFSEVESLLTPTLYSQLNRAYHKDTQDGNFLDFDPWSNTQMGADGYTWGKAKISGNMAKVPITVRIHGGGTQKYTCILQHGETWQVANLVYDPKFDLLTVLKDINK